MSHPDMAQWVSTLIQINQSLYHIPNKQCLGTRVNVIILIYGLELNSVSLRLYTVTGVGIGLLHGLHLELKHQHYSNIVELNYQCYYMMLYTKIKNECSMEFTIYKPEGLRLQHTSAARKSTNGTINLPSRAYQSNSSSQLKMKQLYSGNRFIIMFLCPWIISKQGRKYSFPVETHEV